MKVEWFKLPVKVMLILLHFTSGPWCQSPVANSNKTHFVQTNPPPSSVDLRLIPSGIVLFYLLPLGVKDIFSFVPDRGASLCLEFIFLQQEASATSFTEPRLKQQGHLLLLLLLSESLGVNGLNS